MKIWYNEELKSRFINEERHRSELDNSYRFNGIFNVAASFERKYGRDLSLFNPDQTWEFVSEYLSKYNIQSRHTIIHSIRRYCRWALDQIEIDKMKSDLDGDFAAIHPIELITAEEIRNIAEPVESKYFKSYDDFEMWCKNIFYGEEHFLHRGAACISWIMYDMDTSQIELILRDDFDKSRRMICDRFIENDFIYKCLCEVYDFDFITVPRSSRSGSDSSVTFSLENTKYLFRRILTANASVMAGLPNDSPPSYFKKFSQEQKKLNSLFGFTKTFNLRQIKKSSFYFHCYEYEIAFGYSKMIDKMFKSKNLDGQSTKRDILGYDSWKSAYYSKEP